MIDRSKTRDTPCFPLAAKGRLGVWNSHRGNHLGQRSCASAKTGRTYGRKRSDQSTAQITLRGGGRPAGKVRLGVITRAGDEALRSVLVVGATAVVQQVRRGGRGSPWIVDLLKRKPPKLAAVALANKMARIAWKLMVTGNSYAAKSAPAALMGAA